MRLPDLPDAVCRTVDPELFFSANVRQSTAVARSICQGCPEIAPCLEWALTEHEVGVWGGTDDAQRHQLRRGLPVPRRRLPLGDFHAQAADKARAARRMTDAGLSRQAVADELGVHVDSVTRYLREAG